MLELVWTASLDVSLLKTIVDSQTEKHTIVGGNMASIDVKAKKEDRSINKVNNSEEASRSNASFETCCSSICSSKCNDDNDVVVSALESLVIRT